MALSVDLVTLENFEQKLPRWDPNASSHRYALVDMGSNGIRFSISDLSPPRTRLLKCLYRERSPISLYDALHKSSSSSSSSSDSLVFPEETITEVSRALARFWTIAVNDYGVPPGQVVIFATEAMRRAENATAMLEAIRTQTGDASGSWWRSWGKQSLTVHVLSPQVETLFGAVGARSSFVDVKGLFLDLGGGSVQMTYLDSEVQESAAALAGQSLPFGAARMTRVLETAKADVQAAEQSKLRNGLAEAFQSLCNTFPALAAIAADARQKKGKDSSGIDVFLCGGGFRGYGSMLMHNDPTHPYPIPSIGSYTVSGRLFGKTKEMLKFNKSYDGRIFGVSKRRRGQFPAIIAVVDALIAAIPAIRSVTFCEGGNREGALLMMLPQKIRRANPLELLEGPVSQPGQDSQVLQDVLNTLTSAFPSDVNLSTTTSVFGMQLGHLYASQIWARQGEREDANAAAALHSAVDYPDSPGLTHLRRAVLGVTLCARWGAGLGPIDQLLHQNLRDLIINADPDGTFWADYTGAVTAALVTIVTALPTSRGVLKDMIRFQATEEKGKRYKLHLKISIKKQALKGVDEEDLIDLFRNVGREKHQRRKVVVTIDTFP
ncbi:putative retrograde regulation protein [Podospora fimiseda]|uniref:Retrograde regulation protein n=1 Tax=Podospora fimiseda TaxID=252190 RepID=A0AAN7H454_9PEZI|nr:putative retrograde regulation protein [Podospora fimiseda]